MRNNSGGVGAGVGKDDYKTVKAGQHMIITGTNKLLVVTDKNIKF